MIAIPNAAANPPPTNAAAASLAGVRSQQMNPRTPARVRDRRAPAGQLVVAHDGHRVRPSWRMLEIMRPISSLWRASWSGGPTA
jgi:hypothetical protein